MAGFNGSFYMSRCRNDLQLSLICGGTIML